MKIVFFGDSICYGYGASPGTSFVERIKADLAPQGIKVINSGVNGDTTADALRRLVRDLTKHKPQLVYIQFGFNDASWWAGQIGTPWVKLEEFLHNLQTMILAAKAAETETIIIANNHPAAIDSPFFDAKSAALYAKTLTAYNEAIRQNFGTPIKNKTGENLEENLGQSLGVEFLDVEAAAKKSNTTLVCSDGVHLNLAGNDFYYQLISEKLKEYI